MFTGQSSTLRAQARTGGQKPDIIVQQNSISTLNSCSLVQVRIGCIQQSCIA